MKNADNHILQIIIADDDLDDQEFLSMAIRANNRNHKISTVNDGEELIELILHNSPLKPADNIRPDIIFLDWNMPRVSGMEVLEIIRKNTLLKDIPVYVLTTSHSKLDMVVAMALGARKFYTKPSSIEILKEIVNNVVADISALTY